MRLHSHVLRLAAVLVLVSAGSAGAETFRSPAEAELAAGTFVLEERIVLDERVLFDSNRARVKHAGRRQLARVVARWRESGSWDHIHIEGHADERGAEGYNRWLAFERSERVRKALVELGADPEKLEVWSFGESRRRSRGSDDRAHQRNRRVELVVLGRPHGGSRDAAPVKAMVGSTPLLKTASKVDKGRYASVHKRDAEDSDRLARAAGELRKQRAIPAP